jgi:hypothetical protein
MELEPGTGTVTFQTWETQPEPEPKLFKNWNRNNFSKVGTGTVENIYGSTMLIAKMPKTE